MPRAATKAKNAGITVEPGMQFRWSIADANPLWVVKKLRGKGVWECEVVNETWEHNGKTYDSEFKGKTQPFDEKDIARAVAMERMFEGMNDEAEKFWAKQKVGATLHFCHGFGAWVRCEVVMNEGQKAIVPKALVGNWKTYDLYRRYRNGRVEYQYNVQKIQEGAPYRPHASNLYEYKFGGPRDEGDPRTMTPVSWDPPPMTAEEERLAKHWNVLEGLQQMLIEAKDPVDTLKLAKDWLKAWEPS